jgi:hypothetical protein
MEQHQGGDDGHHARRGGHEEATPGVGAHTSTFFLVRVPTVELA